MLSRTHRSHARLYIAASARSTAASFAPSSSTLRPHTRNLTGAPRPLMPKITFNQIGNTPPPTAPATYEVHHPGTGALASTVQCSTEQDLVAAIDTASATLPQWSSTPLAQRKAVFDKAADLLEDKSSGWAESLFDANVSETSCSAWWAQEQLNVAPGMLRALTGYAEEALKEEVVEDERHKWILSREPYGVCLAMAAWNAVHLLTMRAIVTPLLVGNTVVLKTSETAPRSQSLWAELLFAAGLPRGALAVVHIAAADAPRLTSTLVADKRVRHLNFTGSTRVGSSLASQAGQHLKPTLMELGGKAPVLLLPDADLKAAASHIVFGAFMNAGQVCMSTERVLVAESQYDDLVAELRAAWDAVKEKKPRALFSAASGERYHALVNDATAKGAADVLAPKTNGSTPNTGATVTPAIYGPITPKMDIYTQETFAPLCALISIPDSPTLIDDMVTLANESDYGLSAGVWGRDTERATAVARRIEAGAVHINAPTPADPPCVPHGGWKMSGWGRFNGVEGLRGFTQMRSIEVPKGEAGGLPLDVFEL